ncbi:MAG: hypothetical protein Q8Q40_13850 [Methylococcaceae bacterium]|nr:hypothetical protein [Methylococcaceae bacterium]MDP3905040.1 hypothetical protein [Methylococcaceae bacterium]
MNNLKNRLSKLEDQQVTEAKPLPHKSTEEQQLFMDIIIAKINASKGQPRKPWVISPVPDGMGIVGAHLHTMLNRCAEIELKKALDTKC